MVAGDAEYPLDWDKNKRRLGGVVIVDSASRRLRCVCVGACVGACMGGVNRGMRCDLAGIGGCYSCEG